MTHSYDRTLLASLGFGDPDKREPLHDLACEYLAMPAQAERLVKLVTSIEGDFKTKPAFEVAISKGEGQYRTTIGFIDLRIDWIDSKDQHGYIPVEVKIQRVSIGDMLRQISLYREHSVEAEISKSLGDKIRDHSAGKSSISGDGYKWVMATAFELDCGQANMLISAGIFPIRLGDGFTKWFEERQRFVKPKLEEF